MKQQVKLNEAQLKKIVAESVKRVLKENNFFVNRFGNDEFDDEGTDSYQDFRMPLLHVFDIAKELDDAIKALESVSSRATDNCPDAYNDAWGLIGPLRESLHNFLTNRGRFE